MNELERDGRGKVGSYPALPATKRRERMAESTLPAAMALWDLPWRQRYSTNWMCGCGRHGGVLMTDYSSGYECPACGRCVSNVYVVDSSYDVSCAVMCYQCLKTLELSTLATPDQPLTPPVERSTPAAQVPAPKPRKRGKVGPSHATAPTESTGMSSHAPAQPSRGSSPAPASIASPAPASWGNGMGEKSEKAYAAAIADSAQEMRICGGKSFGVMSSYEEGDAVYHLRKDWSSLPLMTCSLEMCGQRFRQEVIGQLLCRDCMSYQEEGFYSPTLADPTVPSPESLVPALDAAQVAPPKPAQPCTCGEGDLEGLAHCEGCPLHVGPYSLLPLATAPTSQIPRRRLCPQAGVDLNA